MIHFCLFSASVTSGINVTALIKHVSLKLALSNIFSGIYFFHSCNMKTYILTASPHPSVCMRVCIYVSRPWKELKERFSKPYDFHISSLAALVSSVLCSQYFKPRRPVPVVIWTLNFFRRQILVDSAASVVSFCTTKDKCHGETAISFSVWKEWVINIMKWNFLLIINTCSNPDTFYNNARF
jgi:hypothetical protein